MIYSPLQNKSGFSTIIAILLTAFLTILSAGILNLFMVENKMNHFLSDGVSAYMSAEWALEYSLLKSSNHREGFSDIITDSDKESELLQSISSKKKTSISSILRASDTSYTGTIAPGNFELIPLFYDKGERIQSSAKNPNKDTSAIIKTISFIVSQDGNLAWNINGNDSTGRTYGIAGTGGVNQSFGNDSNAYFKKGFSKQINTNNLMTANTQMIDHFLATYENNYLILSNISDNPITYHISGSDGFTLPERSFIASSTVGKSKQNIDFQENRSQLFDILKYSIFNKQ